MPFTNEQRRKSAETRRRNAEQRRLHKQQETVGTATTEVYSSNGTNGAVDETNVAVIETPSLIDDTVIGTAEKFDWHTAPLKDALERFHAMRHELARAEQVLLARQSKLPQTYTCWTWLNRDLAQSNAKSALAQCKHSIPDGKWAMRDDGAKDSDGNISPAVCCSMLCFQFYQSEKSKRITALSRH